MALNEQAEELEGEAATWQLLGFLHGLPDRCAGLHAFNAFAESAGIASMDSQLH